MKEYQVFLLYSFWNRRKYIPWTFHWNPRQERKFTCYVNKSCSEEQSFWDYSRNTWKVHSSQQARGKLTTELSELITSNS